MDSLIKDDGSELNDSEIDEWAEIDEVGDVISGSEGSKEEALDIEHKSGNSPRTDNKPIHIPVEPKQAGAKAKPSAPAQVPPAVVSTTASSKVINAMKRDPEGSSSAVTLAHATTEGASGKIGPATDVGEQSVKRMGAPRSLVSPGSSASVGAELQVPHSVEIETASLQESPPNSSDNGNVWGGWGKWNLGASLQQAVGSAMKDVQELGTSFQQVLTELADEADTEEEEERSSPGQDLASAPENEQVEKKREILERLRGPDTALGSGAKAVDTQVEQVTTGAFKTLGNWFGGAVNYSQTLATKVEEAARLAAKEMKETVEEGVKDISSLPAIQAASSGLATAPTRAAGLKNFTLEKLGKTAVAFLENNMGLTEGSDDDQSGESLSFDQCFYIYGGHQSLEELEALSNECARSVNRVRSRVTEDNKAVLDQSLALLSPFFSFKDPMPAEGDTSADSSAMGQGHKVIADLCQAGLQRAGELSQLAVQEASALAAQPDADLSTEVSPEAKAEQFVVSVQQEGVKKLAELCSLCVERLLALGRSVSAQFRYGKPADDGIQWPPAATEKAKLMREQACRMLTDVKALSAAYKGCLQEVHTSFESKLEVTLSQVAESLSSGWETDETTATCKLQDGFRGLLYIVLLTTVDRQWL